MALVNTSGNYIRINKEFVKQMLSNVHYNTFQSKAVRDNPSEFDQYPERNVLVEVSDLLLDQVVTALYTEVKKNEGFKDLQDA
jgi:hypothetical protein